jgi:lipid II:glycine glycyltransferase (peptidoglycan interpeptide bridge formation enzyme)
MIVSEIKEKNIWEGFLLNCKEKTFLDSWNWGEFQKMMGDKIWRLGIFKNSDLISIASVIKIKAKRGSFLFSPHAPVLRDQIKDYRFQILDNLVEELKKIAKEEKTSFVRISPIWIRSKENIKVFKDLGFLEAPIHMHPELTWELDITPPEDRLLMQMRKTTRYLIRQAQKNPDVKIEKSQKLEDVKKFNKLYQATVDRHHFVPFSLDYLKNEFSAFLPDNQAVLLLGNYKEELIASAIIIFWQGIAFYHQGASSLKYPKIPVSYLLQWEAIREAKNRDCQIYNFWGIAPDDKKPHRNPFGILRGKHPWAGLTLFKTGFSGYKKEYVKTQDLPLSSRYFINYLIEISRRIKRGL